MITVGRRAHRHPDAAGDPLDGLVNLFDLGIVLSVGFLLAALSALHLATSLTQGGKGDDTITVPDRSTVKPVPSDGPTVIGHGRVVGKVYQLDDGRYVYVVPSSGPTSAGPTSSPSGSTP